MHIAENKPSFYVNVRAGMCFMSNSSGQFEYDFAYAFHSTWYNPVSPILLDLVHFI